MTQKKNISSAFNQSSDINPVIDQDGNTRLHQLCQFHANELGEMEILLRAGADPNVRNAHNKTPLALAIEGNNLRVAALLLKHQAAQVVRDGDGDIVFSAVHYAAEKGRKDALTLLLKNKGGKTASLFLGKAQKTALMLAVDNQHEEVVEVLAKAGVNMNVRHPDTKNTVLHIAAQRSHLRMLEELVKHGASIAKAGFNAQGFTPLHLAASHGQAVAVEFLLKQGADVNEPAKNDYTPLMLAIRDDNATCIRTLVESGADVNAALPDTGETPLMLAVRHRSYSGVQSLLAQGANVLQTNRAGKTAQTIARELGARNDILWPVERATKLAIERHFTKKQQKQLFKK